MRVTRQSEIAIAILGACARRPNERVRTSVAAAEAGASRPHTAKVVHLLVHAGVLTATRGRHGGLRLARPAETIPLSTVLQHTQPELVIADRARRRRHPRATHLDMIVDAARSIVAAMMDRFTVADLVTRPVMRRIACADCRLLKAYGGALQAMPVHAFKQSLETHVPHNG